MFSNAAGKRSAAEMASDRLRREEQEPSAPGNPVEPFTASLAALLEVPALTESLRRAVEVANAVGRPAGEEAPLPPGVRADIGRIAGALAFAPSFAEIMRFADTLDLRDLNEMEVAYLERVSLKTVQRWRTQGTGPEYRCEAGILYPIRWLMEWRARGRQRMTAQKKTRGRRRE
jgi:hypothetical protein